MPGEITIDELRSFLLALADHVQAKHGSVLHLQADYYWEVDPKYSTQRPLEFERAVDLQQYTDDLDNLRAMVTRGEDPPIGYGLLWLGSLLRRLGWLYPD